MGGVWTKLKEGIFLENSSEPGVEKKAGLPNITGTNIDSLYHGLLGFTGASYLIKEKGRIARGGNDGIVRLDWGFDASKSNSIYGKSTTVQPHSITTIMWQREQ